MHCPALPTEHLTRVPEPNSSHAEVARRGGLGDGQGDGQGGGQGDGQGAGAWQRTGCTPALEAMPAEGLGELNRLHSHRIAS